jgi:hypothetical protein
MTRRVRERVSGFEVQEPRGGRRDEAKPLESNAAARIETAPVSITCVSGMVAHMNLGPQKMITYSGTQESVENPQ